MKILFMDSGLFTPIAERLAEDGNEILYHAEWRGVQFPTSDRALVGTGITGLTRIESFWDQIEEAELVVFPDVYQGDLHDHLRRRGCRVWGCGGADFLELDRVLLKQYMRGVGLPMPKTYLIQGVEGLIEHLQEHDDLWIKGSKFRGDFETFHHQNLKLTLPWLNDLTSRLGPKQDYEKFVVEEPLKGCEVGFDGYTVDGEIPPVGSFGYEVKDAAYIGKVVLGGNYPAPIRDVFQKLAPAFKAHRSRTFLSFELRIGDDRTPYLIDPCLRGGSPPSEVYMELFENWTQVILAGADGDMVALVPRAKYGAQIILKSDWAEEHYLAVDYPAKYERWVKLHNHLKMDGQDYVAPLGFSEFGSAVGIGDTVEEAMKIALGVAESVKGYRVHYDDGALEKSLDCIEEGIKAGISWT